MTIEHIQRWRELKRNDDRTHSAVERVKEKYGLEMALKEEQELIIHNGSDVLDCSRQDLGSPSFYYDLLTNLRHNIHTCRNVRMVLET